MFNIITPTYNRAHTLNRVYDSLINQREKQFTWIIVDDCSSDSTEEVVNNWITENIIKIEYHKLLKNQGKPYAVNYGLNRCMEDYTIIADSDDSFSYKTLSDLRRFWNIIDLTNGNIGAIWTLVKDENGKVKGDPFPKDFWQANFKERILSLKKPIDGDKWHCWKTEVLRKHPLYTQNNCHIGESHTWNRINETYDFLCINIAYLKAFVTEGSLINSSKTAKQVAIGYYYSSYYAMENRSLTDIISYKYYRILAFEYIKSKFYFNDPNLKLSFIKTFTCSIIFTIVSPIRLVKKFL
ncbi:glycosyltransferase involved in cell wall biosynthesis [Gelidibacter sediminis]|uniref:Glycosyltransferase involved in cell wall biosynthesis n=1 Tax=Gelidibacter sediminis TaxID=1608710 RepID=A0A4R7Q0M3_9FLAO|nr:glycosyltransferase family 2 protein [Gelidibacter sediminis]TDU40011.1 glycosyltransferase involved in cell wall biosynthesis [Gelidibacter sediminis]